MTLYPAFTWKGAAWQAPGSKRRLSRSEYYEALESLSDFLDKNPNYVQTGSIQHRTGQLPDIAVTSTGAFHKSERTIQLTAQSFRVISRDFIRYLQKWLSNGRTDWRIVIPTVGDVSNWVTVYATSVRIGNALNPSSKDYSQLAMRMVLDDPGLLNPDARKRPVQRGPTAKKGINIIVV